MKTSSFAIGILFADFYTQLLKYRMLKSDEERKSTYPKLHGFVQSSLLKNLVLFLSLGSILFGLTISHTAIASPYSWTMFENALFYTFGHTLYALANITVLLVIFCGGATFAKAFLSRPFFLALGKLCFIAALITPIMVQLIYSQMPSGLFVSFEVVLELGVGNVICVMVAGIILYLLIEFPLKRIIQWSILPAISSDKQKHSYFVSLL